jgi:hypothetical protein
VRDELATRNVAIAKLQAELDNKDIVIANLENQLSGAVAELKDRDIAIAKLKSELEARGKVKQLSLSFPESKPTPEPTPIPTPEPTPEPEPFNSNQKVKVKVESPAVNTEPEPEPEPTPTPEPIPELIPETEPEPIPTTGTLNSGELVKHILEKFPDSTIKYTDIRDAVRDKHKKAKGSEFSRLAIYERDYGFKYLGKIDGVNRFKLI